MKTPLAFLLAALSLAVSGPALAADASQCNARVHDMERELSWRRDQMSTEDRMRAHQRLSAASSRCTQDSDRAALELRDLQRDLIQQSRTPPTSQPGSSGSSGID